jgi:hypothetical protein
MTINLFHSSPSSALISQVRGVLILGEKMFFNIPKHLEIRYIKGNVLGRGDVE